MPVECTLLYFNEVVMKSQTYKFPEGVSREELRWRHSAEALHKDIEGRHAQPRSRKLIGQKCCDIFDFTVLIFIP